MGWTWGEGVIVLGVGVVGPALPVQYPSSGTVHSHTLGPEESLSVSQLGSSMCVLREGRL